MDLRSAIARSRTGFADHRPGGLVIEAGKGRAQVCAVEWGWAWWDWTGKFTDSSGGAKTWDEVPAWMRESQEWEPCFPRGALDLFLEALAESDKPEGDTSSVGA